MDRLTIKSGFLASICDPLELRRLFEHVPGVFFFVKDTQSRLIAASQAILDRLGLQHEDEIVGTTDHEFFPREIADNFARDDRQIFETGQPLIDRLEIWYNEQRILDWFITTKLPMHGKDGEVIGLIGITHSYEGRRTMHGPFASVSKAVEYIRQNYREKIGGPELAKAAGMSERHLTRKFQEAFGMAPHEFVMRTRIQAASEALARSDASIIEIAIDHGFCDQSAFTVQFRKRTGMTPKAFRARYRN